MSPDGTPLDPQTLCPRATSEVSSPRTTVVVLDRTDPITEIQQQDIAANLTDIFRSSVPHERFVIYSLDAKKDIVLDGMVRCNPLEPKKDSVIPGMGGEKEFEVKQFKEKFLDPLVVKIKEVLPTAQTTQTDSPIMEMIQAVAVRDLKRSPKARLILVSDLMQHSARYSQYKSALSFAEFRRSVAFKEVQVDLSNTDVRMMYIGRTRGPSSQPPGHQEFWHQYFSALNAKPILLTEVRGEGWK